MGHEGVQGGPPHVAGHTWGVGTPHVVSCPPFPSRIFLAYSKKMLFQKYPKSAFTIHDDIFQRPFELKIFMWA